ncbi:MAG: multiple antibiotic resistance protein [Variibacter sp.]|jgi:multiple antibiotic resistance protein|nr:multiple antibiotic resistance protein [Variibacter sp.]
MTLDYLLSAFVTLAVVVDPIGLAPIFVALTQRVTAAERTGIALRTCLISAAILVGFALAGQWFIAQLGISLSAFRIAGGLLLFAIASEMVFERRTERQARTAEQAAAEHQAQQHLAVFPLAIPLTAGPAAITATLLLAGQADGRPLLVAALLGIIVLVIALCFVVFFFAGRIAHVLGTTGSLVLSRLLGIVLAALAVQYVIDGVKTAFLT